jgi:hypothetical protein
MISESPVQVFRVTDVTSTGAIATKHIYKHYLSLWVGDTLQRYLYKLSGKTVVFGP